MWFNPFVAQVDVVCGTETGFGGSCQIVAGVTNTQQQFAVNQGVPIGGPDGVPIGVGQAGFIDPQLGVPRDSYWPRSLAAMAVVSLALIVLSVQLVSPTRRWRLRRGRPRRRPVEGDA
jgi:hypothetical protein